MSKKLNALMGAVALLAVTGANAAITPPSTGDSELALVAIDNQAAPTTSLFVDLGVVMSDFTSGSLTSAGTTVVWDLNNNTRSVNGAVVAGLDNAWTSAFTSFMSVATSSNLSWGVLGGDQTSALPSGRGFIATGNPDASQLVMTTTNGTKIGNAITMLNNFYAAANNLGTMPTNANGGEVATSGVGYLWDKSKSDLNGNLTWNMLLADNASSTFQYQRQTSAVPGVTKFGSNGTDGTFVFNSAAGTLTWSVAAAVPAVPEPGTYGLMVAGLAAMGFVARRRKSA